MNPILIGISLILICPLIFIGAWRSFAKGKEKQALLLLVLGGLILRVFTSSDFYLHDWDERFHALVAKNLINHPLKPTLYENPLLDYDFRNWSGNHIWVHKQPLPLWTIAGSLALFGFNEIALRLPSIILSSIAILLVFKIAKHFFNPNTAFWAAFLLAINGLIVEITAGRVATDHPDVFFMFFILWGIYLAIKHINSQKWIYCFWIGISMGCAILSKWLPAIIILPIWLLMAHYSKKFDSKSLVLSLFAIAGIAFLIAAPWQFYIYENFPMEATWEASFNWKHFTSVLDGREGSPFYFLDQIRINYGELIYLPILWFFIKAIQNIKEVKYWVFLIWTIIPLLIFSLAQTKMQAYILFTAPAYFSMTAAFFDFLLKHKRAKNTRWIRIFIWILFLGLPLRYSLERIKPFDPKERSPEWVLDLKKLKISTDSSCVLFNYPRPIEAMFYTDMMVYEKLPDRESLKDLQQKNYKLKIFIQEGIPQDIYDLPGLDFLEFKAPK